SANHDKLVIAHQRAAEERKQGARQVQQIEQSDGLRTLLLLRMRQQEVVDDDPDTARIKSAAGQEKDKPKIPLGHKTDGERYDGSYHTDKRDASYRRCRTL